MPRTFVSASSQGLDLSSAIVSAYPHTMMVWANPTTVSATGSCIGIGSSTATGNYYVLGITSAAKIFSEVNSTADSIGTTSIVAGSWNHLLATGTSAIRRDVYLNGVNEANNTGSATAASVNHTTIGCAYTTTSRGSFFNGILAHAAIWNVVLTQDEIILLAKGRSPLRIRPGSLVSYVPIWGGSPEPDEMTATGYTLVGAPATTTNVPPISQPSNNFLSVSVGDGISVSEKIR